MIILSCEDWIQFLHYKTSRSKRKKKAKKLKSYIFFK